MFGAGISVPAGIMSGKDLLFSLKSLGYADGINDFYTQNEVREIFKIIFDYYESKIENINKDFKTNHKFNYEEIYYDVLKIIEVINGMNANAFAQTLKLKNELESKSRVSGNEQFKRILKHFNNYIYNVVLRMINTKVDIEDLTYLDGLVRFIKNNYENILSVATLNYDCLIEMKLTDEGVEYIDGFRKLNDDEVFANINNYSERVEIFDRNEFLQNTFKLLKLHGSLNWSIVIQEIPDNNVLKTVAYIKDLLGENRLFKKGDKVLFKGIEVQIPSEKSILIGSDNKIKSYNYGLHLRMTHEFQNQLDRSQILIVSGYSFGDDGVNLRILDWLVQNPDNQIVINSSEETKGEFIQKLNDLIKIRFTERFKNQVSYIPDGIENLSEKTILEQIS